MVKKRKSSLKEGKNHGMVRTAGCGGAGTGKKDRKREAEGLKQGQENHVKREEPVRT